MRPAIFFDRDNTLIVSDGYLGEPAGVRLIAGAAQSIARARALGFAIVVVSNQSGVARGLFTEADVVRVNRRMDELLRLESSSAVIDRHAYCPFHPEALVERYRRDSELRKPRPGMLFEAAAALELDLTQSWMIGDAPRDVEAGVAAGCRAILVQDPALHPSPAAQDPSLARPEAIVASLREAMDWIERTLGRAGSKQKEGGAEAPPSSQSLD